MTLGNVIACLISLIRIDNILSFIPGKKKGQQEWESCSHGGQDDMACDSSTGDTERKRQDVQKEE